MFLRVQRTTLSHLLFGHKHFILDAWRGFENVCAQIASNDVLCHHNKLLIAFVLVNTIQYPRTLKNNIYYSNNRVPLPFFSFGYQSCVYQFCDPFFWQNPCSGCNSGIDLVVALEYTFSQLSSNAKQISVKLPRFRRSYVKHPAVVLTSHISYTAFLLDMRCAVQSGYIPNFCSCLFQMIVYLRNLFFSLLLEC